MPKNPVKDQTNDSCTGHRKLPPFALWQIALFWYYSRTTWSDSDNSDNTLPNMSAILALY